MTNRLDELTAQELAQVLNERFGDTINAVTPECDKCDGEKLKCKKCGGMLNVNGDVCTQCGMMPEAIDHTVGPKGPTPHEIFNTKTGKVVGKATGQESAGRAVFDLNKKHGTGSHAARPVKPR